MCDAARERAPGPPPSRNHARRFTNIEIERKYLLAGVPRLPADAQAIRIEQGYLPPPESGDGRSTGGLMEGRLRRATGPGGARRWTHTVKRGRGVQREEVERPITERDFEAGWPLTEGRRLSKTRYRVRETAGGTPLVWEIDVFDDRPLVLAEVELSDPELVPQLPPWLAPHVVREVTDEPAYSNYALACGEEATERRSDEATK